MIINTIKDNLWSNTNKKKCFIYILEGENESYQTVDGDDTTTSKNHTNIGFIRKWLTFIITIFFSSSAFILNEFTFLVWHFFRRWTTQKIIMERTNKFYYQQQGLRKRKVETYNFFKNDWDVPPVSIDKKNGALVLVWCSLPRVNKNIWTIKTGNLWFWGWR